MPTKAEITKLSHNSAEFVSQVSARLVADYQSYLRGESVWLDSIEDQMKEMAQLIDLLMEPLLTYAKEHILHMPTDTYVTLSGNINNILETQEALIEIITRRTK